MLGQYAYSLPPNASFNPATLSLTLWQRDYAASAPWSGTASAGSSGSNSLVTGGSNPTAGTALNGHGTASFNGTTNFLTTSTNYTNLISNASGSLIALFNASVAPADPGATAPYNLSGFLCPTTGDFGFGFSTSGVRGGYFNGSIYNSAASACGTGAWHLAQMKWDSANINVRVDSGAWVPVSFGAASLTAATSDVGPNFSHSSWYTGLLAEMMAASTALSDATFDNIKTYINARYGLSL